MAPRSGGGDEFKAWPDGTYRGMVTESDYIATKAGNGHYLMLTMACLDDSMKSRLHWENFNLDNPSVQTMQIAMAQLKSLAIAIGIPNPDQINDSSILHNKPFLIGASHAVDDVVAQSDDDATPGPVVEEGIEGDDALDFDAV